MAEDVAVKLPTTAPAYQYLTQEAFTDGVVTLVNQTNLGPKALAAAQNILLYEKGVPGPRWGTNWFGNALPNGAAIDGAFMYQAVSGANHIVAVGGGNIYRSLDNAVTWTLCTGATFTSGKKAYAEQGSQSGGAAANYMYISNGFDYPIRYDGSTVLIPFIAISPPSGLSAAQTGLAGSVYTYYYRISAVNAVGTTQGTTTGSVQVSLQRAAWDPTHLGTHFVTLSWTATAGAVRYDIYVADNASDDAANNLYYLDSVGAVASPSYIDNGQAVANPNATVPIQNTTGAPRCREFTSVGSRLYGVQDRDFPYRVWYSGSGPFLGYFSDSYDGGYIDLQRGSQFYPIKVADYRDGKGTPLATVWCNSADTRGCVWQIALTSTTILNTQFTQPSANKLPGSRGTSAPNSVVNVLNDYLFFNYQAIYNLGSRASFLNLLSTDESSANIRPSLTTNISPANVPNIAAYYFQAKVFISAPFNNATNNQVIVYDTEQKAYLPEAYYGFGFERMFQYTDTSQTNHLMFWKPGDSRLSETSSGIMGDYGQPFQTNLLTGLMPTQKDRFAFMYVEQAEVEFASSQGGITVELLGIDRTHGYGTQKTFPVAPQATASNVGWSTNFWTTNYWSDTSLAPTTYSELSNKRYCQVMRDLNAYQWSVRTNSIQSSYRLRTLQLEGTATDAGMPRQWRVTAI